MASAHIAGALIRLVTTGARVISRCRASTGRKCFKCAAGCGYDQRVDYAFRHSGIAAVFFAAGADDAGGLMYCLFMLLSIIVAFPAKSQFFPPRYVTH